MHDSLKFETPENVQVRFHLAGLGTRFIAWFIDQFLMWIFLFCLLILLVLVGVSLEGVLGDIVSIDPDEMSEHELGMYVIGLFMLAYGLGSFVYFSALELLMHGQTLGKRACGIRVVKLDGFSLDASSILIRNVFRVIDTVPFMWLFPLLSQRSQRSGDMVGGTIVVNDETPEISDVRTQLSERSPLEAEFRFDAAALKRLQPTDLEAVERLLERWHSLPESQREGLTQRLIEPLVAKLRVATPPAERRVRFLEDLLAAEYRRQNRRLG